MSKTRVYTGAHVQSDGAEIGAEWVFDPVPPSGAIRGGIPVAYVFPQELEVFVREILQNAHDQKRNDVDTARVSFDLITLTGVYTSALLYF